VDDQLFFRETESAPRMYGARFGSRPVVITFGWPFPTDREVPTLHVFDASTGRAIGRIEIGDWYWQGGHLEGHVTGRDTFVAGLDNQAIRRWDLRTGTRIETDLRPADHVTAIRSAALDDRTLLVVATHDGRITCYDAESGVPVLGTLALPRPVRSLCAYRVGETLLVAAGDDAGGIWRWNPATGEPAVAFAGGHSAPTGSILYSAVGGRPALVTSSGDRTVCVWDAASGEQISMWIAPASFESAGITGVEVFGAELIVSYADSVVHVNPVTGESVGAARQFPDDVYGIRLIEVDGLPTLILSSDMFHRLDPSTFAPVPLS
jgi:WD40 repeat protein